MLLYTDVMHQLHTVTEQACQKGLFSSIEPSKAQSLGMDHGKHCLHAVDCMFSSFTCEWLRFWLSTLCFASHVVHLPAEWVAHTCLV
jgi:hypothetical protein